jgi:hypothetical protein
MTLLHQHYPARAADQAATGRSRGVVGHSMQRRALPLSPDHTMISHAPDRRPDQALGSSWYGFATASFRTCRSRLAAPQPARRMCWSAYPHRPAVTRRLTSPPPRFVGRSDRPHHTPAVLETIPRYCSRPAACARAWIHGP